MTTLFLYSPAPGHSQEGHPENSGRAAAIYSLFEQKNILADLQAVRPEAATLEQLALAHSPSLIEQVRRTSLSGDWMLDADTYVAPESFAAACLAAGAACTGVDHILGGAGQNGLVVARPPGHHASTNRAAGFCLFNNVATAARHAQKQHGLRRVLILDFDVHHGDGTQSIFYQDPSVLFVSLHLYYPYFYPGTGSAGEVGTGAGVGYTLNAPLPPYVGDVGYRRLLRELVEPRVAQFRPELVLVSAGFDAHWADPLSAAGLSLVGYAQMARDLVSLAGRQCQGRILFVLEGGYLLRALSYGVLNVAYALLGRDQTEDPLGPMPQPESDVTNLLVELQRLHLSN
ncbi:MAG: histone deacetylase [Chloroflexota bacterium]